MKMSCKLNKKLLYDYSDKSIDSLEKIFIEEHLKYCEECNKELEMIKLIEINLKKVEKDIHLPEKLSTMSELIVLNCMALEEERNSKLKIHNYFEHIKSMRRTIIESQKLSYNNPYNQFIKSCTKITADAIRRPIKNYYKKKVSAINLFKFLKVG
jgi:hypothetical protein